MYAVFLASILAAFLAVTGRMHAMYLPGTDGAEGMALAANFLQYQKAALRAAQDAAATEPETDKDTDTAAGTVPDIRPYLPPGFASLGDWGMTLETTADGTMLYVYGKEGGTKGTKNRLAVADVCRLARKQTGTGVKEGNVLVPWNTALPAGIPEGAVVMTARIR